MARLRRVAVAVTLPSVHGDVTLPALVRDRFVDGLVGSSGDAQSGRRLYAGLVRRRRVVALIRGLDRVGQGEPLGTRRAAIARLLEGSLVEGIPFVAWVHPDLAPSISEVAAFRTRPLPRSELVAYTVRQLDDRGLRDLADIEQILSRAFDDNETTRDPVLLSLSADLVLRRVRMGERGGVAVTALFLDPCAFRRHFAWMCEWALDRTLDELEDASTPAALALASIGKEAHYRQEADLRSDDASAALDADERRRFAAGVALLSHRGVLDMTTVDGSNRLRFTHPAWLAFAGSVGLRLNPAYWRDHLRPDTSSATLDALTGALLIFDPDVLLERSFLRVLRVLGVPHQSEISLDMALSVIASLQSSREPLDLGDAEMGALERAWSTAGDVVKTRFVSDINLVMNPRIIDFLWRRVVPPGFGENSFRVRRTICSRLGSLGSAAWKCLGRDWRELVDAASTGDLSSRTRQAEHWRHFGYGVASLGWTLPGILWAVEPKDEDDVFALLAALRKLVERNSDGKGSGRSSPEIGLEISLAEGFKAAAVEISARREACDERWFEEAASLLKSSTSWISKQALLQSLALVLADTRGDRLEQLVGRLDTAGQEHPFVQETTPLVRRALAAGREPASLDGRDIWLEEVEALEDGGATSLASATGCSGSPPCSSTSRSGGSFHGSTMSRGPRNRLWRRGIVLSPGSSSRDASSVEVTQRPCSRGHATAPSSSVDLRPRRAFSTRPADSRGPSCREPSRRRALGP